MLTIKSSHFNWRFKLIAKDKPPTLQRPICKYGVVYKLSVDTCPLPMIATCTPDRLSEDMVDEEMESGYLVKEMEVVSLRAQLRGPPHFYSVYILREAMS